MLKTHNRPHTSTDNPYSEAQFRTLTYRPGFPARFDSIEHARGFCREFFDRHNHAHRHSGIGLMTPATVHHGRATGLDDDRARVLAAAYAATPERFLQGTPEAHAADASVDQQANATGGCSVNSNVDCLIRLDRLRDGPRAVTDAIVSAMSERWLRHLKHLAARILGFTYRLSAPKVAALERFYGRSVLPLTPAYAFVQDDLIQNLPAYLGVSPADVHQIVIVGAWHAEEVEEMLERFPNCRFLLLEPSRQAFDQLSRRLGSNPRVQCLQVAAADTTGTALFHETNVTGNGSLLPLTHPGETTFLAPGIKEVDTYRVSTTRLDALDNLRDGGEIHCLWVDVQGLELPVLEGAMGVLDRVHAAFVEVATDKRSYKGATSFVDLYPWMSRHAFRLASLGTDPANGQGNALWLKTLSAPPTD